MSEKMLKSNAIFEIDRLIQQKVISSFSASAGQTACYVFTLLIIALHETEKVGKEMEKVICWLDFLNRFVVFSFLRFLTTVNSINSSYVLFCHPKMRPFPQNLDQVQIQIRPRKNRNFFFKCVEPIFSYSKLQLWICQLFIHITNKYWFICNDFLSYFCSCPAEWERWNCPFKY